MDAYSIPVSLLRQWCFCPRIVYYRELLQLRVLEPMWSIQGSEYHKRESELFKRRNLSRFNLSKGAKHHNVSIQDKSLKLHGICDLIIETLDSVFVVEYKLGNKVSTGHIIQVLGHALLAEKKYLKKANHAFILTGNNKVKVITIDSQKRKTLKLIIDNILKMLKNGCKPSSSATASQCGQCEYLNYCNDREM